LIIKPRARGQIDVAAGFVFVQQRGDEEARTKEILVVHQPGAGIIGIFDEQRAHHGQAVLGGILRLGINVGH